MSQSPIDIETAKTVYSSQYANLVLKSYDSTPSTVNFKLINKEHTGL